MMIVILPIVAFYVMRNKKMGDDSLAGTLPERKSFLIALASALDHRYLYDGFTDREPELSCCWCSQERRAIR